MAASVVHEEISGGEVVDCEILGAVILPLMWRYWHVFSCNAGYRLSL